MGPCLPRNKRNTGPDDIEINNTGEKMVVPEFEFFFTRGIWQIPPERCWNSNIPNARDTFSAHWVDTQAGAAGASTNLFHFNKRHEHAQRYTEVATDEKPIHGGQSQNPGCQISWHKKCIQRCWDSGRKLSMFSFCSVLFAHTETLQRCGYCSMRRGQNVRHLNCIFCSVILRNLRWLKNAADLDSRLNVLLIRCMVIAQDAGRIGKKQITKLQSLLKPQYSVFLIKIGLVLSQSMIEKVMVFPTFSPSCLIKTQSTFKFRNNYHHFFAGKTFFFGSRSPVIYEANMISDEGWRHLFDERDLT